MENGEFIFYFIIIFYERLYFLSHGLPTRSLLVVRFMQGLQRYFAKQGVVSTSACAITQEDMYNLYNVCIAKVELSSAERRSGIVRYVSYLLFIFINNAEPSLVHLPFCLASDGAPK